MAGTIRALLRLNVGLTRNLLLRNSPAIAPPTPSLVLANRLLFTDTSLGLTGYENSRMNFRNQFANVEDAFRVKMREIIENPDSMVFTEDMKAILHLSQKSEEDLHLIRNMLIRYNSQNSELRFGRYIFGPVVMRALYFLDEPQKALELFLDPELTNMFNQKTAQQILMMLLYKHQMYDEVRKVYETVQERNAAAQSHSAICLTLLMAACLKQNTPESLQYALEKFRDCSGKFSNISRQSINILSTLCLKQKRPEIALEVSSTYRDPHVAESKTIKILCYIQMKRYADIIPLLRLIIDNVSNQQRRMYGVFTDVPMLLEEQKAEWIDEYPTLAELVQQLRAFELVLPKTLEEHSLTTFNVRRRPQLFQRNDRDDNLRSDRDENFRSDRYDRNDRRDRFDRRDDRNYQRRQDRQWSEARRNRF